MAVTMTDEGQDDILARLILAEGSSLRIGLHTSNAGAGRAVTLANLGVANFSGYAAQTPAFAAVADSAAGRSRQEASELTFTHNGGGVSNVIIGWHLYHSVTNKLWLVEAFGAGITMDSNGDFIKVKPVIHLGELAAPL